MMIKYAAMLTTMLLSSVSTALASGTHEWEWAGVFSLPDHSAEGGRRRSLRMQRSLSGDHDEEPLFMFFQKLEDGTWPDPQMKVLILPTDECDAHGIEHVEEQAEAIWGDGSVHTNVSSGAHLTNGTLYSMKFPEDEPYFIVHFEVELEGEAGDSYAMFMEHFPFEFEGLELHYFKDAEGHDLEMCAEEPASGGSSVGLHGSEFGGTVFGACLIVAVVSLVGVLTVAPVIENFLRENVRLLLGFSCGAIVAAAFFLLSFEGNHMMFEVGEEADQAAVYGVSTIFGILTGFCVQFLTQRFNPIDASVVAPKSGGQESKGVELANKNGSTSPATSTSSPVEPKGLFDFSQSTSVAWAVFWGDAFHNISDGIVIASAFLNCSKSFGWTLTGVTVAHELSQELADWFVLTGPGRLSKLQAVAVNVVSSLSVILGGMIIVAIEDEADSTLIGIFLNYGAGCYIYIALVELAPEMFKHGDSWNFIFMQIAGFCIGCAAIGLVLLNHEHCVAGGDGGDAGGHAH